MKLGKPHITIIIFLIGNLTIWFNLAAQNEVGNLVKKRGDDIKRENLAKRCLAEYQFSCNLIDKKGKVSQESINRFLELFWSNAKVWNDLVEKPYMIDVKDYTTQAFVFLEKVGLQGGITDYLSLSRKDDYWVYEQLDSADLVNNYYVYEWVFKKEVFNGLDSQNNPVQYPDGRQFYMKATISASLVTGRAHILKIRPYSYEKN